MLKDQKIIYLMSHFCGSSVERFILGIFCREVHFALFYREEVRLADIRQGSLHAANFGESFILQLSNGFFTLPFFKML